MLFRQKKNKEKQKQKQNTSILCNAMKKEGKAIINMSIPYIHRKTHHTSPITIFMYNKNAEIH